MISFFIYLINLAAGILELLIVVEAVLSFFLHPLHPIRQALRRIVGPMLAPIQQIIPPLGGFDISPIVLIFLIEIIRGILVHFLIALAF